MPKDKPPTGSLYPRESIVCFFVFLMKLATVWAIVAIIYLLFANYFVYSDEKNAGIVAEPAMCTTTRNIEETNCTWWSCMEWCLSKTKKPDSCVHIYSAVRKAGNNITLQNCSNKTRIKSCPFQDLQDPHADFIYDCKEDFTCTGLTGTYKCEDPYQPGVPLYKQKKGGLCKNITEMFDCSIKHYNDTPINCKKKRECLDLSGIYQFDHGIGHELLDFHCERRCKNISCDQNVMVMSGDDILMGDCDKVVDTNDKKRVIWQNDGINTLLANCLTVKLDNTSLDNTTYIATDCINGTLMPREEMPAVVNFTRLLKLFADPKAYTLYKLDKLHEDEDDIDIPFDVDITLWKEMKTKFNYEGCSNLLSEHCTVFHKKYGQAGKNYTPTSRFPCYYSMDHEKMDYVIAELNLPHSEFMFILLLVIPVGILTFSCIGCFVCSAIIIVDNQGHMHLKCCYDWFRPPFTEYEKWSIQHEKQKKKRLAEQERLHQEEQDKLHREETRVIENMLAEVDQK